MRGSMGRSFLRASLILLLTLVASPALALRGNLPDFTQLVKQNSAAVVNISTTQKVTPGSAGIPGLEMIPQLPPDHPLREFLDRFRGEGAPPESFDAESLG